MDVLTAIFAVTLGTVNDVLPIAAIIFGFQFLVLRQKPANLNEILWGSYGYWWAFPCSCWAFSGACSPWGRLMAEQLTDPVFIQSTLDAGETAANINWTHYYWVYIFAFLIGFSTTIAEPSLIAVAIKANEVSGGAIGVWGLRISVAIGVAVGISLGCLSHRGWRPPSTGTSWPDISLWCYRHR